MIESWFLPQILEMIRTTLNKLCSSEASYILLCSLKSKIQKMIDECPYSPSEELEQAIEDEYGVLYSADGTKLIKGNPNLRSYNVKQGTKVICDGAFIDSSLKAINLPDTLISIGCNVFSRSCLKSIAFPNSVKDIGYSSLDRCTNLDYVSLPNKISYLSESLFCNSNLLDIELPPGLKVIGKGCFRGSGFSEISIPQLVESIDNEAFANCQQLNRITFKGGFLKNVGKDIFKQCDKLEYIIVPHGKKDLFVELFKGIDASLIHEVISK